MARIQNVSELEAIYGAPSAASTIKEMAKLTPHYRRLIEVSPFAVLATVGPEGVDCSPRGDMPGFVRIVSDTQLMMPDRRGNNRMDSLRNIVRDPRVALLFLIPGSGTTFRINGKGHVTTDQTICDSFAVDGKSPRSVVVIDIDAAYFQCARAVVRSNLWEPTARIDPATLPTAGQMLAAVSQDAVGGPDYDAEWPQRARNSLW